MTESTPMYLEIYNDFAPVVEQVYDITITPTFEDTEGIGGLAKNNRDGTYDVIYNINEAEIVKLHEDLSYTVESKWHMPHVILHELAHVVDFAEQVSLHHAQQEISMEFFADYMAWFLIYFDSQMAWDIAHTYVFTRFKGYVMDENTAKTLSTAAEAFVFMKLLPLKEKIDSLK